MAIAQTGSGKTAAFAIPVINQIHSYKTSKRSHSIKCLVMVPTRELAKQIGQVFAKLSRYTKVTTYAIYGGVEQEPQKDQLAGGIDVLIATPGRMFDMIRQEVIDISGVSILVLDEADRMLDLGFIDDIERIKRMLKQRHQTLFFSATINPKIKKLAYSQISSSALRIQVSPEKQISKNITHSVVRVEMDDKRNLLMNFIVANPEIKCIVFVRTQVRAERVTNFLKKHEVNTLCIHGGMDQLQREASLDQFRLNKFGFMIATDVTARGIDLPDITHVLNYDLPDNPENYVHRIGRTGRGFARGEAISFFSSEEKSKLDDIEAFIQTKIVEVKVGQQFKEEVKKLSQNASIAEMVAFEEALWSKPKKFKAATKTKKKR